MPSRIVQHIADRIPNLPRKSHQRHVIALRENTPPTPKARVDALGQPYIEPLHPLRQRRMMACLADQVNVIALHRKVANPKTKPIAPSHQRPANRSHQLTFAQPPHISANPQSNMHNRRANKLRPRAMCHRPTPLPRPTATPLPSRKTNTKLRPIPHPTYIGADIEDAKREIE
jgi:hypothetical protein